MMNRFATKQDMMTDKMAFYKTEKAFTVYRSKNFAFEELYTQDENKAWQIVNTAVQNVVGKKSYIMYIFIIIWLLGIMAILYKMQGTQAALEAYNQLPEFEKYTTGRLGRIVQILQYFRWQEYVVIVLSIIPLGVFSKQYGKWNIEKIVIEIESLI